MLENDITESSVSAWRSSYLLVDKSDGSPRFCTDFHKVNAVPKPDSFPFPRTKDYSWFSTALKPDLLKGYWRVPLTPHACKISAFVTSENFRLTKSWYYSCRMPQ